MLSVFNSAFSDSHPKNIPEVRNLFGEVEFFSEVQVSLSERLRVAGWWDHSAENSRFIFQLTVSDRLDHRIIDRIDANA